MKCLLIGGSSKIAINFINDIVGRSKNDYICIDNVDVDKEVRKSPKLKSKIKFFKLDINKENIDKLIKEYAINTVINFHEVKDGQLDKIVYTTHNYDFVVDLYDVCKRNGVNRLVHMSTANVYGNSLYSHKIESDSLKSTDEYTVSKINAELYLLKQKEVSVIILRVAEVFGLVLKDSFLDSILRSIVKNETIYIHEDSDFVRSYIDIQDCIYFIDKVCSCNLEGVYNISSNLHLSAKDIISYVTSKFDYTDVVYTSSKKVAIQSVKVESNSIQTALDYKITQQSDKYHFYIDRMAFRYKIFELTSKDV